MDCEDNTKLYRKEQKEMLSLVGADFSSLNSFLA